MANIGYSPDMSDTLELVGSASMQIVTVDSRGLHLQARSGKTNSIVWEDIIGSHCKRSKNEGNCAAYFCVYAYPLKRDLVRTKRKRKCLTFKIDRFDDYAKNLQEAKKWKSLLSMRHESPTFDLLKTGSNVIVIVNPFSGTGRAQNLFNEIASPIFNEADINFVTMQTEKRLHAKEMIKCLSLENIDAIIVCAGDGVLFEVVNGLMSRPDWEAVHKTPLGILPGGTGNALASSLLSRWKDGLTSSSLMLHSSLLLTKKKISPLDLMLLETDSGDKMCSFLSVCYGLISDVDIESEKYRGLGIIRNTVGSIIRIVNLKTYNCRFSYQSVSSTMNKSSTVLGINNVSHTEENDNSLSFSPSMPQGICYQTVEEESQSCTTLPDSSSLTSFRVDVGIEASEHCGTSAEDSGISSSPGSRRHTKFVDQVKIKPSRLSPIDQDPPSSWQTHECEIVLWCALNISHLTSDAMACPPARIDDGLIHIIVVRKGITKLALLNCLIKLDRPEGYEEMIKNPFVEVIQCNAFRLDMITLGILTVDGEAITSCSSIQGEILESQARLITGV